MRSGSSPAPWLRALLVTALVLVGLATVWIVLIGPSALILLSPR